MNIESSSSLKFRKDIQGLRGLAVLFVVFYHSNFSFFKGGFIGVDIFFVISGYLIIKKILVELINEEFSLKTFYLKRIARILPALYFILTFGAVTSVLIRHPLENIFYAKSSLATLLFVPNFFYWRNIDYFSSKTEVMHLIHTWSLGVEEQFYFFLPVFLSVFFYLFKDRLALLSKIFYLLIAISFLIYVLGYYFQLNATFYLLPFRLWEFLFGGIIAILELKKISLSFNYLNYVLIIFLFFCSNLLDPNNYINNYLIFIPILLTSLIILNQPNKNNILLSNSQLVLIGNISYSLYLFHQPLFAYTKLYGLFENYKYFWIIFSILFSFLIYYQIEERFRNYKKIKTTSIFLVSLTILIISINLYQISINGNNESVVENYNLDLIARKTYTDQISFFGNLDNLKFILYGDSYADHFTEVLRDYSSENNIGFISLTTSACISYENIVSHNGYIDNDCEVVYYKLLDFQKKYKLDIVISQNWEQTLATRNSAKVYDDLNYSKTAAIIENIEILQDNISENKIIFIGSVPGSNLKETGGYFRCIVYNNTNCPEKFIKGEGISFLLNIQLENELSNNNLMFINPYNYLCDIKYCYNKINESIIYYDYSHLSFEGAKLVLDNFISNYKFEN